MSDCRLFMIFITVSVLFFPLNEGGCLGFNPILGMRGCVYRGVFMPLNTTAEIYCMSCKCLQDGNLSCCRNVIYRKFPSNCKQVPDGPCGTKVVMKHDPSTRCDITESWGVGK